MQDESIQTQLCSRKEENMAKKKIKKEKIDNVGIHS
ncbi:carbohydrate ABC transporter permease, partial [Streptococcus pneumoniae]